MLGRFLELSLPTPRILESWQWYQRIGFVPATDGEVWSHRYAVVTDGRIAIGLHEAAQPGPRLTWVHPGLAAHVAALESRGIRFEQLALGDDRFHQACLETPGGHGARLLEARTYSMPAEVPPAPLGWFEEIALPVRDLAMARDFWEQVGFVVVAQGQDPWPWLSLTSDTLSLALHATAALDGPTLVFSCDERDALVARLAALDVPIERVPRSLDPAHHLWLRAPEGTTLWVAPPPP